MSKHRIDASRLGSTCAAALVSVLAALGASACQSGIGPQDTVDPNVAAEALEQSVGVTADKNQRAAPAQESIADQALELRLNDALIFDPLLPPSEISLAVQDGHVRLTGSVGTFFDSVEATDVVSRLYRVSSIDNQLQVRQPGAALCLLGAR